MRTVGAYEAKTHLSHLLDEVQHGHRIGITRNGQPVAVLSPASTGPQIDRKQVVQEIRAFRRNVTTGGMSTRAMIEEGRRF